MPKSKPLTVQVTEAGPISEEEFRWWLTQYVRACFEQYMSHEEACDAATRELHEFGGFPAERRVIEVRNDDHPLASFWSWTTAPSGERRARSP
jgi:hypothetical protein